MRFLLFISSVFNLFPRAVLLLKIFAKELNNGKSSIGSLNTYSCMSLVAVVPFSPFRHQRKSVLMFDELCS